MPDLVLKEDLLAPEFYKTIKFNGHHVSRTMNLIPALIKDVFKIETPSTFNDGIKWDDSGANIEFFNVWRAKEGLDARTTFWVKVSCQGNQSKQDKLGDVSITITGFIKTKFPYSNFFDKLLVEIYANTFYKEKRKQYIDEGKKKLLELENRFREEFNILRRSDIK